MAQYDAGPPQDWADLFTAVPDYSPYKSFFWYDWGPVFYRGRLDGTARVLCIASDPGPTERIANRTLVGDAGQRVQGFLKKIGITRSYLCLNAFAYALIPEHANDADAVIHDPLHRAWRNNLYTKAKGNQVQVVIAFGAEAQKAVAAWDGLGRLPLVEIPHPSDRDTTTLANKWRAGITQLRGMVTPDADGTPLPANYGARLTESDFAPIPRFDLAFGTAAWLGDDHWLRTQWPPKRNCVSRPSPDDRHTLIWIAPRS